MSLVSFSRLLATASNTQEMLEMLAESVRTELKASASVVLTVEDPGHLRVKASAGIEGLDGLALELSISARNSPGRLAMRATRISCRPTPCPWCPARTSSAPWLFSSMARTG